MSAAIHIDPAVDVLQDTALAINIYCISCTWALHAAACLFQYYTVAYNLIFAVCNFKCIFSL